MVGDLSFGHFLGACRGSFPSALVGELELERLLSRAERLPLCVLDQRFGFEFELGNEKPDADFCVVAVPGSDLAAHFVREGRAATPDSPAAALGACLAEAAGDPASALAARDGSIVLEYDVSSAEPSDEPSPPGVFFTPRGRTVAAARGLFDRPGDVLASLCAAAGWQSAPDELRQVERVCDALPDAALVAQAGAMPGRAPRAVRLVIHRIDPDALPGLLLRLGWRGSVETAVSVIADTTDVTQRSAVLSVDVTAAGVAPRLGMELFLPPSEDGSEQTDRRNWSPVIDRLEERAWCLPAKAQGLRAWPGTDTVVGAGGLYRVHRFLNHMKAVVHRGQVAAKAYAAVSARRFDG